MKGADSEEQHQYTTHVACYLASSIRLTINDSRYVPYWCIHDISGGVLPKNSPLEQQEEEEVEEEEEEESFEDLPNIFEFVMLPNYSLEMITID